MVEQKTTDKTQRSSVGQALVEYALIIALVAIAFGVTLAATGPAIGNVFCNVVSNLGGETADPRGGSCGATAPDLVLEGGDPPLFWQTVTWVAANPQGETPFPTPIHRAATSVNGGVANTPTPSQTPTNTATRTATNTATNTATASPGPSPTNSDMAFSVPFVDQIDNPKWWRLDLADLWTVQWYGNHSYSGSVSTTNYRTINFSNPLNTTSFAGGNSFDFDWGSGHPSSDSGITGNDNFGGIFQRTFFIPQDTTYTFNVRADDQANLYLDGASVPFFWTTTWNQYRSTTYTLPAGMHTIRIDYSEDGGGAWFNFAMTPTSTSGPVVTLPQDNSCTWGRTSGTNDPSSILGQFDENPSSDTWTAGQTCYLELRGYVDLTGHSNPLYTYWDLWDFSGAGNVTAELQVSNYITDGSGNLDRSQLNWQTIASRSAGTSNYNWTRSQIPLNTISGLGSRVTFRYVIGSSSGGTPFRWYIDDIQILDAPATSSYTVGNQWNLNARDQMNNFIFDADSNKTLEDNPSIGDSIDGWRWNLTSTNTHGGTGWDDSPGGNYQGHSQGGPRIHYLEFKQPIDLTTTRSPAVPVADAEGDAGVPLLSFWQAYDIRDGASIRVQYTRDAHDTTPDMWTDVDGGILVDFSAPSGVPRTNEQTLRTNLTMQQIAIDLTSIPNWDTQQFRLRFALVVNDGVSTYGDGWYIDDIRLEREDSSPFIVYPFSDDAENATFMDDSWSRNGWGQTTERGGANSSTTAYSDSPSSQYATNATSTMELSKWIDLLNDTVLNTTDSTSRPAAVNPILTFWHRRDVGANVTMNVDILDANTGGWTTVWTYDSNSDSSFRLQTAWNRVEVNLAAAVQTITGSDWATVIASAADNDDDIKVRFRFTSGGSTPSDGVYIDNISINDASTTVHNLWTGTGGNGSMVENVESAVNMGSNAWRDHWYVGGNWTNNFNVADYSHSGLQALTDSVSGNYGDNAQSILELIPMVNLTSTTAANRPMLYFWTRYDIGNNDNFRIEIATEDSTSLTQAPDKIGGWTTWTAQPMMIGVPQSTQLTNERVVTWLRGQVDLSSFIGKRIRVRFVLNVPNNSNQGDGIYLDDIAFTFGPSQVTLPFTDTAQSTGNWITEGTWGLGKDAYVGTGQNSDIFGSTQWTGTFWDGSNYQSLLDSDTNYLPSDPAVQSGPKIGPLNTTEINYDWGGGVPFGLDNNYQDSFVARFTRQVTLAPGTYYFRTISDDGVRLYINDGTGVTTSLGNYGGHSPAKLIINNWGDHGPSLDPGILTVTGSTPIVRTLTLEFYENGGGAVLKLFATSRSYSFSDSPNQQETWGFSSVYGQFPANASLVLNGYFDTSASTAAMLSYKLLYDISGNNYFTAEYSTDGGMTWTARNQVTNSTYLLTANQDWRSYTVALPSASNLMIRFRLDSRTAYWVGDGIWLADISVLP